jgi:tetratricopeptide (TPR) repeat protein
LGKIGNDQKKIELIDKAIQINPNVAAYHRNIGAGYYSVKEYEKAIQHHLRAIELEPNNSMNYHNLGSAYFRAKNYEAARK